MVTPKVIEHNGIRVLTTKQLAEAYETTMDIIKNNFRYNRTRYIEGKHFIELSGERLREAKRQDKFQPLLKQAKCVHLWTEKGALLHAKSLNTDRAWESYDHLIDFYFRIKEEKKVPAKQGDETEITVQKPVWVENTAPKAKEVQEIRWAKGMVMDTPNNKEAQRLIAEARKYLTGMDALLDVYNMYLKEDDFEKVASVLREMQGRITWATSALARFKPKLVEKFL